MVNNTSNIKWNASSLKCLPLKEHITLLRTDREQLYDDILVPVVAINAIVSVLTVIFNGLIIWTIPRTKTLRTPQNILVFGLAMADFGVGAISQSSYCVMKFAEYKRDESLFCSSGYAFTIGFWVFSTVSFGNLTVITVDRFLAIQLHLRYKECVTTKHYGITLALLWASSLTLSPLVRIYWQSTEALMICMVLMLTVLSTNAVFLVKLFKVIHKHSVQIRMQRNISATSPNTPEFKNSVNTLYFITAAFVLCYFPYFVSMIILMVARAFSKVAVLFTITETLVMLNSLFNPIIYFWKFESLRKEAAKAFGGLFWKA